MSGSDIYMQGKGCRMRVQRRYGDFFKNNNNMETKKSFVLSIKKCVVHQKTGCTWLFFFYTLSSLDFFPEIILSGIGMADDAVLVMAEMYRRKKDYQG